MGKALTGAAEIGAAAALVGGAFLTGGADLAVAFASGSSWGSSLFAALATSGIASEAGAIANALAANRGAQITTRQPAANGGIVYGEYRVGGILTYASTTGSHKDQYNRVITLACHPIDSVVNLYLDGRQVFWTPGSPGQQTRNGVTFGGAADGSNHYDAGNNRYNFGTLVYASPRFGDDPVGSYASDLHANDPTWAPDANGSPYGGDCSWCYVKVEFDTAMFPQNPEFRFTIRGRNSIWDPRTNSYGYSANWALIMADVLMNPDWGLGIPQSMINYAQLITAANICDEEVPLANGTTEPRYTYNGAFDTSAAPGDIIDSIMSAAQGAITYSGGQWYIWPAAAFSPSFSFTQDDLIGGIQGVTYKSARDLCNRVSGVYTSPNYPYTPVGNLYNANGRDPDNYSQNNFNLAWQKTSYPTYAQDPLHSYAVDQWLQQDGGVEKWATLNLPGVISVATAQRLAKIYLLRNRLQRGSYNFKFKLGAFRMAVQDVFELTYPQIGWTNKQLQVTHCQLAITYDGDDKPVGLHVEINASDYDPGCYAWSATEELTILATPAYPSQGLYDIEPIPEMTVESDSIWDFTNVEGVVIPQVHVGWTDPPDAYVTMVDIQWSPTGLNTWVGVQPTAIGVGSLLFSGPAAGAGIDVRIRSMRGDGATSTWLQVTNFIVSTTSFSSITSVGVQPNVPFNVGNDATIDTIDTGLSQAELRIYGPGGPGSTWQLITGAGVEIENPVYMYVPFGSSGFVGKYTLHRLYPPSGANPRRGWPTTPSGPGYYVFSNYNDMLADGYILIGSFVAVSSTGTGGTSGGGGAGGGGTRGPRSGPNSG